MADLPFAVPFDGEVTELLPDVPPVLDGYEQVASYHVGEPWRPPPPHDADAVTVTPYRRLDLSEGRLVPAMFQVTYWRRLEVAGGR
jgi:hypothetical protein